MFRFVFQSSLCCVWRTLEEMGGLVRKLSQQSRPEGMITASRKEDGFQRCLGDRIYLESDWVCEERDVFLARGTKVGNPGRGTSLGRSHRHRP